MAGETLPHVRLLLRAIRITPERLTGDAKIAIDAGLLRALLRATLASMPFDEDFYLTTYPDIAGAHRAGDIADLRQHFIERGYLEGRCGAPPALDDEFYRTAYRDVDRAIARGEVGSAIAHYVYAGAAEGRLPNEAAQQDVEYWASFITGPRAA